MFFHNLKYTIKILFKNKTLIFWTFAFPIILGIFFNLAFSNIDNDSKLQVFDVAVVNNQEFQSQDIYKTTLDYLSSDDNKNKIFNIKYVSLDEASKLLNNSDIYGYVVFYDSKEEVVIKENGLYQTLFKFVINEIKQNKIMIENLSKEEVYSQISKGNYSFDSEKIANDIVDKMNSIDIPLKNVSNSNLDYMQVEYYTLIAMACMYGGMLGLTAINNCLANLSNKGKRVAVSPNKKSIIILSSLIASYIVSLIGNLLLMLFLIFVLKADFGSNIYLVFLLFLVGSMAGISLGILISTVVKKSENTKIGVTIAITMMFSVLSGMMGVTLKYVIDKNIPIVNLINPNNLITDGFYSLYYYNTLDRYFRDLLYLLIFILISQLISFISLRREKYDSI